MQLPKFRGNNLLAIKYGGYFKNELERSLGGGGVGQMRSVLVTMMS